MPILAYPVLPYSRSRRIRLFLASVIRSLFLVLSEQKRLRFAENAVPLTNAGMEMLRFQIAFNSIESQSSNANCLPFLIPISPFLRVSEELIMTHVNRNDFPVASAPGRAFFDSCGLDRPLCRNLIWLQSFLRHLLQSGSPSYFMPNDPFIFPSDPFRVTEDHFLSNLLQGFTPSEIQFVRNGYSEKRISFLGEEEGHRRVSLHSLSWSTGILFSYISQLNWSESELMRAFCLRLALRYIDYLVECLKVFSHPNLMFNFVWECYRFSGLLIENFSCFLEHEMVEEDLTVSVLTNGLFHLDWLMPYSEWCFLSQGVQDLSSVDLCRLFMRSYNSSGRNLEVHWFDRRFSYIPEASLSFFQEIFLYWLTACQRTILPFINVDETLLMHYPSSLCLYRAPCSLVHLASVRFLKSGRSGTAALTLDALDALLNGHEVETTEPIVQCYLTELMIFSSFYPSSFAMKYTVEKLRGLVELMNISCFFQAKACFLSMLRGLPYCEKSFTSFCHIQLTIKIFLSSLNQLGSSRSNVETDVSALNHYWEVILGCSAFNFDQSLDTVFWKQVIELSRYQFNPIRQARLNELYPVRTRRPDSDWLLQLFYFMNRPD